MLCITSNIASQRSPAISAVADITSNLLIHYKMNSSSFSTHLYNEVSTAYDGTCTANITAMATAYPSPLYSSYLNLHLLLLIALPIEIKRNPFLPIVQSL